MISRELSANDAAVLRRFGRIVATRNVELDIGEAVLVEMRAQLAHCFLTRLIGHQAQVELRYGAPGQNGFAAGAGVPGNETFDVDRWLRGQPLERLSVGQIVDPVTHAEKFLLRLLVAVAGNFCDQFLLPRRERADILEPVCMWIQPLLLFSFDHG